MSPSPTFQFTQAGQDNAGLSIRPYGDIFGQRRPGRKSRVDRKEEKKKSGQRAWTVQEILAEAERQRLASLHVAEGGPPAEIMAGEVSTFDELRTAHATAVEKKEVFSYTNKDGSTAMRSRKLRADAPTLHTSIISLPVTSQAALDDPALLSECRAVLQSAMDQERRRIEALGGKLMLGVIHLDEGHVHAHLYALDLNRGRVDHLHPGKAAKKSFHDQNADTADLKTLRKAGNKLYCDAMRAWQDEMYDNVFRDAGLLRVGPRSERLTTADYNKRKKARAAQAAEAKKASAIAAQIQRQKDEIAQALQTAEETERELNRKAADLQGDKIDLLVRESEAASLAVLSRKEIEKAQAMAADAAVVAAGLARGMDAVEAREVDYRPAGEEKPEDLVFGPNAPAEKTRRDKLKEAILPAFDMVLGFARRVFRLREREAALAAAEADRQAREKALAEAEAARAVRARDLPGEGAGVRRRARTGGPAPGRAGRPACAAGCGRRAPRRDDGSELSGGLGDLARREPRGPAEAAERNNQPRAAGGLSGHARRGHADRGRRCA